jgi:hypothetical protein
MFSCKVPDVRGSDCRTSVNQGPRKKSERDKLYPPLGYYDHFCSCQVPGRLRQLGVLSFEPAKSFWYP